MYLCYMTSEPSLEAPSRRVFRLPHIQFFAGGANNRYYWTTGSICQ